MQAIRCGSLALLQTMALAGAAQGQAASPDERARATEQQMTDDERFSLILSLQAPLRPARQAHPGRRQEHERRLYARRPAAWHSGAPEQ